ncbi:MarR family winged helix-turn-helix transcriptional regulator [Leptolyngbya sp. NIES-2104]|uniref:MarR family winged helix-turn-helix transcriptional regulator n=1 Tax=Leptolyngbya sp. NIES-2104 TaxID=1552121 RepID=UPI0006ECBD4D|nr:MarR family transcriptional regulator [Leptolyngbya sp. NIES-2104]GAQ00022.1 transcriptional regulator, MarR family [Leptolyngbya sp. NIES-2104]
MNSRPTYTKILNFYRAYVTIETAFYAALSQFGLSSAQWGVLRFLREHPGASGAEIARDARVTPQAVATMLQRLEKAELITRQSAEQGRAFNAYLTTQGTELLQKGDQIAEQIEAQVFADFSNKEKEQFNQYILRCIKNIEAEFGGSANSK